MKHIFLQFLLLIINYFTSSSCFVSHSRYNFLLNYFIRHRGRTAYLQQYELTKSGHHPTARHVVQGNEKRSLNKHNGLTVGRRAMQNHNKCGIRNIELTNTPGQNFRIVGGKRALLGAWPWIAALGFRTETSNTEFLCGGALISSQHILTAAHCVHGRPDLYLARLGEHNIIRDDDGAEPLDILTENVIIHEKYDPESNENDIALLKLNQAVVFNRYIQPVCLPTSHELQKTNLNNSRAWIAGWGAKSYQGPSSPVLLQLGINILDNGVCRKSFESFGTKAIVDERILCAGVLDGGKDACQGDSGGPLMWEGKGSLFYVIGVISFGYKCAEPGFPGIYTNVLSFVKWIEKNMKQ